MVPATGVSAPADLAARFSSTLNQLDGRRISTDALFETLKIEALDWGIDNGVEAQVIDTEEAPVGASPGA